MRIFDDLRSGLTPAVEELHQGWDDTYPEPLRGRELLTESLTAAAFLVTALAMAALVPSERSFDPLLAGTLVAVYAVMARVRFPIGHGFTIPTELVLVPMLFLAADPGRAAARRRPACCWAAARLRQRRTSVHRAFHVFGDCWHAVGPARWCWSPPALRASPGRLAGLPARAAAQFAFDFADATVRERLIDGTRRRSSRG